MEVGNQPKSYTNSQDTEKVLNYFNIVVKTDYFVNFVKETRQKNGIPENGFKDKNGAYPLVPEEFEAQEGSVCGALNKDFYIREVISKKICQKFGLDPAFYLDYVLTFVYYNILFSNQAIQTHSGLFVIEESEGKGYQNKLYPILIRLSPYASQRDLISFIKNKDVWKNQIKVLQEKYKNKTIKIGKFRSKNKRIQERNDFIFAHRGLTRKKIVSLVMDKFRDVSNTIDEGSVSKIISLENKVRKEVGS